MIWRFGEHFFDLSSKGIVLGILNVTPDSFSDGGSFGDTEAACAQGLKLLGEGADVLDVGGESTRPGASPVDEAEELRRILPVINDQSGELEPTLQLWPTITEGNRFACGD